MARTSYASPLGVSGSIYAEFQFIHVIEFAPGNALNWE